MKTTTLFLSLSLLMAFFTLTSSTTTTRRLEISLIGNRPIVIGLLNGKAAAFLIDSGSDFSILSEPAAKDFLFEVRDGLSPHQKIAGIGGISSGGIKDAGKVDLFLNQEAIQTRFRSCDLSHLTRRLSSGKKGVKVVGIIGSDILLKYGFVIDYENKSASFQHLVPQNPQQESPSFQWAVE